MTVEKPYSDIPNEGEQEPLLKKDKKSQKKDLKHSHKKLFAGVGVLAVILAVAGAGFWVWHEQPSFCDALCHYPMNTYVDNYSEGDGMARIHAEAGVTCLECHPASISQQVSEAFTWVTGDFKNELDMIEYDNATCLTCHISMEFQASKTDMLEKNPHADAHQVLQCTDCHRSHRDQNDYCAQCHDNGDMRMLTFPPEGHELIDEPKE
ncbi:cytochrome c3 family protein [Eggerthella sp. YY7918]|uniref:cytochrome c3 family protein n=1 Tax=Eggerthella sp. (strain YY7918) TaxID=502558 RepID=UPI00021717F8|nr:cytochrome c3 family protein [Eggerthella sp. YY7918]BAK44006.1 nitrate/TMAO reductase [Eggerthella sp. YY7918]